MCIRDSIRGVYQKLSDPINRNAKLQHVSAIKETVLQKDNVSIQILKNTFYEDVDLLFEVSNDTLKLHTALIPLQKSITINFDISKYKKEDKTRLFIGSVSRYGNKLYYSPTKKRGNTLSTRTKYLGSYSLGIDSENPEIKAINFKNKSWISNHKYLKVKINDKVSGIKNYRATLNERWILMEYDLSLIHI